MSKAFNQCLDSLRRLSETIEAFAHSCGFEEVHLQLDQRASDFAYAVSNWLIGDEICARLNAASEQTALCAARVKEMKQRHAEQSQQLLTQTSRAEELEAQLQQCTEQLNQVDASMREAIRQMISMRDALFTRMELMRENGLPDTDERIRILRASLLETANVLDRMGVSILEDSGAFDPARHTAVDTEPTDDPALDGCIARVFRPGYLYQGKMLRGQDVIIFKKG